MPAFAGMTVLVFFSSFATAPFAGMTEVMPGFFVRDNIINTRIGLKVRKRIWKV